MNPDKEFRFTIARPWEPEDPDSGLCIYTYGQDVHVGTRQSAEWLLDYVKRKNPEEAEHYAIYKVKYKKVK